MVYVFLGIFLYFFPLAYMFVDDCYSLNLFTGTQRNSSRLLHPYLP